MEKRGGLAQRCPNDKISGFWDSTEGTCNSTLDPLAGFEGKVEGNCIK